MYRTIEAIYQQGQIVPLEKIEVEERSRLLVIVLDMAKKKNEKWKQLRGKYKNKLPGVEEFILNKQDEKLLEL